MKKEFKDLTIDEKKEFKLLDGINSIGFAIIASPLLVLVLLTENKTVAAVALIALLLLSLGYFLDRRELKKDFGV